MYELRGITAGYGEVTVLDDVDLRVPEGKVVALLGANGAGKTTLLRVASRSLAVDRGSLSLDGADVSRASPQRLARGGVCHVPEGRGVFPSLTVRENLAMFAQGVSLETAVERAVHEFPALGSRLSQIAGTMSGGEQQMLALSRACIVDPKVVLLDEVSLGLAPRIVDELFVFLTRLASTGVSLLLVEQYVDRALAMADHVYLLDRGRITFDGHPDGIDANRILESYVGVESAEATGSGHGAG